MNNFCKKIIQKTIAMLIIFIMFIADFALVGITSISYARHDRNK